MDGLPFIKMHGLGNDFVIIDARTDPISLGAKDIRAISDRRTGVGCDQLIVLEPARDTLADAFMRIHNADGNEVGACGNVSRCVGTLLMAENGTQHAVIETQFGLLDV
ncbi:MAG: diaminopimelate epimerase, partial [Rhodospirillales bacterium]|nr:diaminopimelate epimerase [Rhodospirillales bacterium]MCW8970888.1 diaminopimelate epimerase [Rhodospirillales bacterium]MCW9040833.1 diaminopimelate epimerase [Rhodospirillales bacterium]